MIDKKYPAMSAKLKVPHGLLFITNKFNINVEYYDC